jgi:hypothetical protein
MSSSTKTLSASYAGVCFGITEKTARLFMYKARQETESGGNNLMTEIIHVDEFVLG